MMINTSNDHLYTPLTEYVYLFVLESSNKRNDDVALLWPKESSFVSDYFLEMMQIK